MVFEQASNVQQVVFSKNEEKERMIKQKGRTLEFVEKIKKSVVSKKPWFS